MSKRRPHPSPVLPSEPTPPLCVMLIKALIELIITLCDFTPLIFAIKPNPQLSLNSSFLINPGIFLSVFRKLYHKVISINYKKCHTSSYTAHNLI